ncbi:MAG: hypothetical protein AMS24_03435 [Chlamydiae bacterium SM23_39]|nr:MAG: hypothetical protein AMS24_03435 [Chlamydiae bacterium SM23_39]
MNKTEQISSLNIAIKYSKNGKDFIYETQKLPVAILEKLKKIISSKLKTDNPNDTITLIRTKDNNKKITWQTELPSNPLNKKPNPFLDNAYAYLKKVYAKTPNKSFTNLTKVTHRLNLYDQECSKSKLIGLQDWAMGAIDGATSVQSALVSDSNDSSVKKEIFKGFGNISNLVKGIAYIIYALGALQKEKIYFKARKEKIKLTKLHKLFIKKLGPTHTTEIFLKILYLTIGIVILTIVALPIVALLFNIPALISINSILSIFILTYFLFNVLAIVSLPYYSYQVHQSRMFRNKLNKYLKNTNLTDKEKCIGILNFLKEQVTVNEEKEKEKILASKTAKWEKKNYDEKTKNKKINKKIKRALFRKIKAFESRTDSSCRQIVISNLERWLNSDINEELITSIKNVAAQIDESSYKKEITNIALLILYALCLLGNFVSVFGNSYANLIFWSIVAEGFLLVDTASLNNLITSKMYNTFIKKDYWKNEKVTEENKEED